MELTEKEKVFLYNALDQINVVGLEQKRLVLTIMVKLAEDIHEDANQTEEKP